MVGGYQIIDASDFIDYNGTYIPKREYKWSLKKPVRLIGLKGLSTNDPDLDFINVWTEYYQSEGDVQYVYTDSQNNVEVSIEISEEDQFGGAGNYPVYCAISITES